MNNAEFKVYEAEVSARFAHSAASIASHEARVEARDAAIVAADAQYDATLVASWPGYVCAAACAEIELARLRRDDAKAYAEAAYYAAILSDEARDAAFFASRTAAYP